ncbi:maltase 2 isoform X2 [Musca domestica]|uniref:alpha-glucosidase n=1 Tax=Musca domestica TaxID=7370 RepID=A0ABM3VFX4_MUSDO|nr:maltase 2 isoform X2 [Musca domestica]
MTNQMRVALQTMAALASAESSEEASNAVGDIDNEWWKTAVFYQIYPRSFMDSNDDGIGDLRGVLSKLSYLAETGITATWLSPIFQSPMIDFGYDISDFKDIHEEYGTMEDFEELISEANRLNIKIILDFVPNHSSDQCEWFIKSAAREEGYEDFYVWADGHINEDGEMEPPNNWQSVFYGSAWTWHPERGQYYYHQFTAEQPDLNYRNSKVVEAMDDVITFWLDKGVSGFRVDAVNHLFEDPELKDEPLSGKIQDRSSHLYTEHIYTKDLPEVYDMLYHWRNLLDEYTEKHGGPARIMMTEAYADLKFLMDYYENADGSKGPHFPFNFFLLTDISQTSDARDYVFNIQKWLTYMPRNHVANWVMSNHDNPRIASRLGVDSVDAMNMLLMTLPGVAVTYNGDEIGMQDFRDISWEDTVDPPARNVGPDKYKEVSRDPVRTPFQWSGEKNAGFSNADKTWLPVHPNYEELNLEIQKSLEKSHYSVYKDLIELRKMPVMEQGRTALEVISRNVFTVTRSLKGHSSILTIINTSDEEQMVNLLEVLDEDIKQLTVLVSGVNSIYDKGSLVASNTTVANSDATTSKLLTNKVISLTIAAHQGIVCQIPKAMSAERRAMVRTIVKLANVILVGLLFYKLWNNKWTKLNFNKEAIF